MTTHSARLGIAAAFVVAIVFAAPSTADIVQMNDGYVLHGRVTQEKELMIDPASGQVIPIVKPSSCFIIDDKVRYTLFSQRNVAAPDKDVNIFDGHVILKIPLVRTGKTRPGQAVIGEASPFNDKWERKVSITIVEDMMKYARPDEPPPQNRFKSVTTKVKQRITTLSPHSVRLECVEYEWQANYLTSEFGASVLMPLIRNHSDVLEKPGEAPSFDKRFIVFRFCTQAGWYDEALKELIDLKKTFPEEVQKLGVANKGLNQLVQLRTWREVELASRAGYHQRVLALLKQLTITELPGALQADAINLGARYQLLADKMLQAQKALELCYGSVVGPPVDFVERSLPVICQDLSLDTLDRLDPFVSIGRQIELDRKNGRESQYTFDQALASAVTGWVLGPAAAEASPATAERLWSVREQILTIQRTAAPIDRFQLTAELEKSAGLSIDEIARLITLLPPPELDATTPVGTIVDRVTRNPFSGTRPFAYKLQMPAEYNPNRSYPLLLVLPTAGQPTEQAIAPWARDALTNGYILACIDWSAGKNTYEYKSEEHAAVIECLNDVKRFANIDTDRVSLTGFAEGANMAIDVGLSHPDLFAAVAPINGRPRAYVSQWYWMNGQSLPFYLVVGELSGAIRPWVLELFEKWAGKGYPSLAIMYRGRTLEYFPGEVPYIFDWMSRKRRAMGFPELGRNPGGGASVEAFQSFRGTDNHFYWASTNHIAEKFVLNDFLKKDVGSIPAATIHAAIRDANQITVTTRGLKQLTLWFGRAYDSQTGSRDMIDFSKPIKITVNGRTTWNNGGKPLSSSLQTLMEDLYQRNDRRRLFLARVDFENVQ